MKYTLLLASLFVCAAHTTHASEPSHQTLQCILGIEHRNVQQITASLNAGADVNHIDNNGKSLFYLACVTGDDRIMSRFITHKDINLMTRSPIQNTPLHLACKFGLTETVESILSKNPQLATIRNKSGQTPLTTASHYKTEKCVDLLIQYCNESTINMQNHDGLTALHLACQNTQYPIIKKLISYGARATIRNNCQGTPLSLLGRITQWDVFHSFLAENTDTAHELIHATDTDGNTQFHLCATIQNVNEDAFNKYLLFLQSYGLNIDTKNKDGKRAVDLAEQEYTRLYNFYTTNKLPDIYRVVTNQEQVMHAFLRLTSPNQHCALLTNFFQHEYKELPEDLHTMEITQISSAPSAETVQCIEAIEKRNWHQLVASLNAGADVNHIDNNGKSLFYLACVTGDDRIMSPFITHKDINLMTRSPIQNTPLHLACKFGLTETVESILSKNPQLATLRNKSGNTPLALASWCEQEECVDLLIQHCNESTINMQNHDGLTALHLACQNTQYPIIKKLILHGANTTIRDNRQGTPLIALFSYMDNNQWDTFYSFLTENTDTAHELIHATDTDGNTQFHLCATIQNVNEDAFNNYLLFLQSYGLNINTRNNDGKRAVDLAEQEYTRLYNFYTTNKLPGIYKVVTNQEQVMHAFLRLTSPNMDRTLLTHFLQNTCKELPEELHNIIEYLYYALNIETIIAKKYNAQRSYYNDFIENKNEIKNQLRDKPEPKLLWST